MPGSSHIRCVLKLEIVVELCLLNFQLIRVITKDDIFLKLKSCQILEKDTLTSLSSDNFKAEKKVNKVRQQFLTSTRVEYEMSRALIETKIIKILMMLRNENMQ